MSLSLVLLIYYDYRIAFDSSGLVENLKISRECARVATELEELEVSVRIENPGSRGIPLVEVLDKLPEYLATEREPAAAVALPPGSSAVFSYKARPLLPGSYILSNLEVRIFGPLGFFTTQKTVSVPTVVTVLPHYSGARIPLKSAERLWGLVVRGRATGGMYDIADLREYSPGDDYRKIVWKAFARTGRLYVREDFGEVRARVLLMLDVRPWDWNLGSSPNTLASVELRTLRSLLHGLARSGAQVDLAVCCSATTKVVRSAAEDVERALVEVFSYVTPRCHCSTHIGVFTEAPTYLGRSVSEYSAVLLVTSPVSLAVESPARFLEFVKAFGDRLKIVIPRFDYELYVDKEELSGFYKIVAELVERTGGSVEVVEESMYLQPPRGAGRWR